MKPITLRAPDVRALLDTGGRMSHPKELHIVRYPNRKNPTLTICDRGGNNHRILAYFVSDEAVEEFTEATKNGLYHAERHLEEE